MPKVNKPRLVNRGPAGLHDRLTPTVAQGLNGTTVALPGLTKAIAINNIAPALMELVVPINTVTLDPNNARLHPERNMEAIKLSLATYGQVKPLVVRKSTRVIIAGNGTLEAALALGWTKIAVNLVEMNEVEAAGYGLADNRTAELAKWDFEVVARLDALVSAAGLPAIGWTADELEVLRAADWVPPPIIEDDPTGSNGSTSAPGGLTFTAEQWAVINRAVTAMTDREGAATGELMEKSVEQWLVAICEDWLGDDDSD